MKSCPVCEATLEGTTILCNCGYDFVEMSITDEVKIRELYAKINQTKIWVELVQLLERIYEVQQKKYGQPTQGTASGWGYQRTSKMLNLAKSTVHDKLRLAKGILKYPELKECKNYTRAKLLLERREKEGAFRSVFKKYHDEDQLQRYLEENWQNTPFAQEWDLFHKGKYRVGDYGDEIDLLAKHREEPRWLVIELKKDTAKQETIGQIELYMAWVNEKLATKNEKVEGIIVSGYPPDERILLTVKYRPEIDLRIYHLNNNGEAIFLTYEQVNKKIKNYEDFFELPADEWEKILENLGNSE